MRSFHIRCMFPFVFINRGLAMFYGVLSALVCLATSLQAEEKVDFALQVRPILSDTCFKCHGPDKNPDSDFRLDTREAAFADLGGYFAIAPGKPEESALIERITSDDEFERMPPPDSGRELTKEQIEILRRWIKQGADWQAHWAFVPPRSPALPEVKQQNWPRQKLDHFVLARLEAEGLSPSPQANKETLIRRATLDLTGLPPTPAEVADFLADDSPEAYEKVVDRLLASPSYGEHAASFWLDAARYSDTNGYQTDGTRTMWPWRDWVVSAFNNNMPFDQFTIEQLAGDLLPEATDQQKLATGFHRNHPLNGEGGRIPEESRVEYVVDRVETTGTVWLGMTVGCARCHDHKYDPVSQREFYRLYAYFNSIEESGSVDKGGNANPVMKLATPVQQRELAEIAREKSALEQQLAVPPSGEKLAAWEKSRREQVLSQEDQAAWRPLKFESYSASNKVEMKVLPDGTLFVSGPNPEKNDYTVLLSTSLANITGVRLEAVTHESFTAAALARSDSGNFVLTELEIDLVQEGQEPRRLEIASAAADFEQGGFPVTHAFDGNPSSGWAVYKPGDMQHNRTAVFKLKEVLAAGPGTKLEVRLKHQSPHKFHNLGRFRLLATSAAEPALAASAGPPAELVAAYRAAPENRSWEQLELIQQEYIQQAPEFAELRKGLSELAARQVEIEKAFPETMVMRDRAQPRETFLLKRGQYDQPDKEQPLFPGVPEVLPPLPGNAPPNRLALARWLVEKEHPLTARVTVNRIWQQFFGTGLVKTTEDFGVQGEPPSHTLLLDFLATEFIAGGWNVKELKKQIVTSAVYRQSSRVTPQLWEKDPDNRLLARASRFRLPAGVLRDQALAISGLLVEETGGPPVRPYQPAGVWLDFSLGKIKYEQDHGDKLYRRSLYIFWRRSVAPTMLFDISSRVVCTVRPSRTNTPLHALTTLNETAFVEAARVFAQQVILENKQAGPRERIAAAFRRATCRAAGEEELAILLSGLERALAYYQQQPQQAEQLLTVGEYAVDKTVATAELAAYTSVMNTILNLDEVLTRE